MTKRQVDMQMLAASVKKEPTIANLQRLVVCMTEVIIELSREVDNAKTVAHRADRFSRMGLR